MINDEITPDLEQDVNETQEETQEETFETQTEESQEDSTDWKAEALKYKAILDRNKNKTEKPAPKKANELDYGQKAYLVANGIKNDEIDFVQSELKEARTSLESLLENNYFKAKLQEHRELKQTANANYKGKGKTSNSSQDSVDYWLTKDFGELPTDFELRKKVVKARREKSRSKGMFTPE